MTDPLCAAAIQMVSSSDIGANLHSASELLDQAADLGARLAVLPENWPLMGHTDNDKLLCQEQFGDGPLQEFMSRRARELGLWLVGGSIPLASGDPEHVYNSCLVYDPEGKCVSRYDKIHLFDVNVGGDGSEIYRESDSILPGSDISVVTTPFGNIGISICYDLRFPELYRRMLPRDISIITVPSAFTRTTGKQHWEILLRSRAVENLCFVIAAGQGGQNNEQRATWGHSMIIGPWGDILCCVETGPGVACADLELEQLQTIRTGFPALDHRKLLD